MPIYEYRCQDCGRISTHLVLKQKGFVPACQHCGGKKLTRLISRVRFVRSEQERYDRLADSSSLADVGESDPRSMARWMKRMGKELGEDLGEDLDQIVEEAMAEETGEQDEL